MGPVMFLLYFNDISTEISSSLRLSADNCVLYRINRIIIPDQDHAAPLIYA